jgi:hypothetical protein
MRLVSAVGRARPHEVLDRGPELEIEFFSKLTDFMAEVKGWAP